jgi:peptide deformylase
MCPQFLIATADSRVVLVPVLNAEVRASGSRQMVQVEGSLSVGVVGRMEEVRVQVLQMGGMSNWHMVEMDRMGF